MCTPQPLPPGMFDLEGLFLGFSGQQPAKAKYILLAVEQEQMAIKVPKEMRYYLRSHLKIGDRIRCIGRSQVDFKSGMIKLNAYQLFPLASPCADPCTDVEVDIPGEAAVPVPNPRQRRAKILLCRKSGCQKRGGRQLAAALEQALRERQLQDQVDIEYTGCQKRCSDAPNFTVMPGKHRYDRVRLQSLNALLDRHFTPAELS